MKDLYPKISIITATYNCERTIQNCIESYKKQDYKNKELIIIDGKSTDNTLPIIKANLDAISQWRSEPDTGIYDALNKGLALATGDVIGFLHADDFFYDEFVLTKIANSFATEEIDAVYGDLLYVNKIDTSQVIRTWISKPFRRSLLDNGWMPPHPTLYVKSLQYKKIAGFDDAFKISADYNSIHQLFRIRNFRAKYINEILVKMRTGGLSNKSLKNIFKKSKEDFNVLRKNGYSFLKSVYIVFIKNVSKLNQLIKN